MIFFGWGKNSKSFEIPNTNKAILTTSKYFHIWWILRVTIAREFFLLSSSNNENNEITTSTKKITRAEVKELMGADIVKPWWFVFNQSLSMALVAIIILVGISVAMPQKEEPLTVNKVLNSSVWTKAEQEYIAKNATDEESAKFETKFKKVEKLKEYQSQRAIVKVNKEIKTDKTVIKPVGQ
jgi:hypothetical protein